MADPVAGAQASASQKARIVQLIWERYGAGEEHPFKNDTTSAVFRCPHNQKWFAVLLCIPRARLGLAGDAPAEILDLKCDPILVSSLQREPGFFKAYHMNKDAWITVVLDDTVPDERIAFLLDLSYEAVAAKKAPVRRTRRSRL